MSSKMSVRAAIMAAARARAHEKMAVFTDQIKESLKERMNAEDRLAGHLLMDLPERDMKEIKRAMSEMQIHVKTLPAIREKNRRSTNYFRMEMDVWWKEKQNESNDVDMK